VQLLRAAVQAYENKNLDGAETIFKQVLAANPKEPNALHLLGCIHKDRGQLQQAVQLFQASIREDGSNPMPFLNLGKILSIAGQHQNAASAFQESLKRNTQIPETWYCFGNALREIREVEKARQAFQHALQLEPTHAGALEGLTRLYFQESDYSSVVDLLSPLAPVFPLNSVDLGVRLCCAYIMQGKHLDAIGLFRAALDTLPVESRAAQLLAIGCKSFADKCEFICCQNQSYLLKPDHQKSLSLLLGNDFMLCDSDLYELASDFDIISEAYLFMRQQLYPRWLSFPGHPMVQLVLSDLVEEVGSLFKRDSIQYRQLKAAVLAGYGTKEFSDSASECLFRRLNVSDDSLWLVGEQYQFPEALPASSLAKAHVSARSDCHGLISDQKEFFAKEHLFCGQVFYQSKFDIGVHGISELYRVHGLIIDTIEEMEGLKGVVDLGYYSCGIFNAGLRSDLKRYCVEPARHHALWVKESGIAEVVPDVPERCVRSFEEYLHRLDAVALDEPDSTAAVVSFVLQLFEYGQCIDILKRIKGFAAHLVVTDDILNEQSEKSVVRLLSNGIRMNLCHHYQRLLSDAGWRIEKKWYFNGVRYASGIIVASAA